MIARLTQASNIAIIGVQRNTDAMGLMLRENAPWMTLVLATQCTGSWLSQPNGQLNAALIRAAAIRLLKLPGLCHNASWFATMCLRGTNTRTTFFVTRSRAAHFMLPNSDAMLRSVLRAAGTIAQRVAAGEAHLRVLFLALGVAENDSRGWICTGTVETPLHERFDTALSFTTRLRALVDVQKSFVDL